MPSPTKKKVASKTKKKCFSCGLVIKGKPFITEFNDIMCKSCNEYYSFGYPGENEV